LEEEEKDDEDEKDKDKGSKDTKQHLLLTQDEVDKIDKEDPLIFMKKSPSTRYHRHGFNPYAGDDIPDATSSICETKTILTLHQGDGDAEDEDGNANTFVIKNAEERQFDRNDLIMSSEEEDENENRASNKVTIKKSMVRKLLSGKERYESGSENENDEKRKVKQHKSKRKKEENLDGLDEDIRFINTLDEKQKKTLLKRIEKDLKHKKKHKTKGKKNKLNKHVNEVDKTSVHSSKRENERERKRERERDRNREKHKNSREKERTHSRSRSRERHKKST